MLKTTITVPPHLRPPKSYILSDIEQLAKQYADGLETTDCSKLSVQLTLLKFAEWLKEQEATHGTT